MGTEENVSTMLLVAPEALEHADRRVSFPPLAPDAVASALARELEGFEYAEYLDIQGYGRIYWLAFTDIKSRLAAQRRGGKVGDFRIEGRVPIFTHMPVNFIENLKQKDS